MLAKITSKNQITIPKKIIEKIPDVKHFDVKFKDGVIIMKPEAIKWAKSKKSEQS
jgi:bifunctional DNA-binding transcriptional regulator/antitoxin component of YhaV-PrlF toxin-antitoxin module